MLRHLDLFSGIGGFALAARMVGGYETIGFCEIEPYCQAVLRKHWPGVPIYDDVRTLSGVECDVITGGFPCQDVSIAQGSNRKGLAGHQSGLWREYARLIREIRPRFALVENTPGLLSLGMGDVIGQLAEIGYDAEWHSVPAAAVGAPHIRERLWVVCYPHRNGKSTFAVDGEMAGVPCLGANTASIGLAIRQGLRSIWKEADAAASSPRGWAAESGIPRVVDGFPGRMDAVEAIGNSVVPQVAAIFLQAIKEASMTTAEAA